MLLDLCHAIFQVRVGNLQELVYKHGQAGVTKASVTIVFNNSDKKASPVGFEHYDQISVTRQVGSSYGLKSIHCRTSL